LIPQNELGNLIDPAWSPPIAIVTSPEATIAAQPEEDPPVECSGL
jgi:hypothetical protein